MNWQNVKMKQVINFIPSQAERSRSLTRLTTATSTGRDGQDEETFLNVTGLYPGSVYIFLLNLLDSRQN